MTIIADIQGLEPGALIELFIIDATFIGGGIERFHGYQQQGSIFWDGQEYFPWPIKAEGFARTGERPPSPTVTVANIDGSIAALCLVFDDMVGAKFTRIRTLGKYLDAANFGGVNPTADPTQQLSPEVWYIERKVNEDETAVQFELASAMDFNGVQLPRRQIIANQCPSIYRSAECSYAGGPVATELDVPTSDPDLDVCSHKLSGCRLRFPAPAALPYGGFPAAGLLRT